MAVFTKRPSYDARGAADVGQYFSQYISIMQEEIEFSFSNLIKQASEMTSEQGKNIEIVQLSVQQLAEQIQQMSAALQTANDLIASLKSDVKSLDQRLSEIGG